MNTPPQYLARIERYRSDVGIGWYTTDWRLGRIGFYKHLHHAKEAAEATITEEGMHDGGLVWQMTDPKTWFLVPGGDLPGNKETQT